MIRLFLAFTLAGALASCGPSQQPAPAPTQPAPAQQPYARETAINLGSDILVFHSDIGSSFLVIEKRIDVDDEKIVSRALSNYDIAGVVLHDNGGGKVFAAHAIGYMIRDYNLPTYAIGLCASACVDIYVAGVFRFTDRGTRFGIHSPNKITDAGYAADAEYYAAMGVIHLLDATYSISNSDMFWFDGYDAIDFGIAHSL